ncbi:hypothetical protein PTSG_00173 [Salpingoeca rosetta]|uniref:Translation initiation factor eIF2B subunit gamma n=1 Tax=Salpingoeca rosetta (strain ATCC 50818 / BSB-021) TaxID=946362 RepID=F2TVQ6_SALR5|nr:uncharacterized protein PTSG_00173 [Salpingoeca rosetta]EGD72152.1 hypothetical protein PTSG_00173 [Salpingoeca rosetta]|eukprot:XP_004998724.1 hypothetical protein PTSG_00173 [Salpingoeca rosetta]
MTSSFQPVVLAAGLGQGLQPLTKTYCKATLPIANVPMISYVLHLLNREGFPDAIIICRESHEDRIKATLTASSEKKGPTKTSIVPYTIETIPDDSTMGTADALRLFASKIQKDVLLLPCDLICNVPFSRLLDVHRLRDASLTMLLARPSRDITAKKKTQHRATYQLDRDIIGLADDRVFIMTSETSAIEKTALQVSQHAGTQAGTITIRRDLEDPHVYILKKWVVDMIADRDLLSSIKDDLVPYLVSKQFAPPRKHSKDIYNYIPASETARYAGIVPSVKLDDRIRCHALVLENVHGLNRPSPTANFCCTRVRTLEQYMEINHGMHNFLQDLLDVPEEQVQELQADLRTALVTPNKQQQQHGDDDDDDDASGDGSKQAATGAEGTTPRGITVAKVAKVSKDVFVGVGSRAEPGATMHSCVIGDDCTIGEGTAIRGCVIMNNVSIGRNCLLTNVCVCDNARIESNSRLSNCNVAPGHVVKPGTIRQGTVTGSAPSFI